MIKLFFIILTTILFSIKAHAGPTGESHYDPLVESYITISKLASDGNINASRNKEVIFSFLTKDQKELVKVISFKELKELALLKETKIKRN